MAEPIALKVDEVRVEDVETRGRLRPVSDAAVAALVASIGELGVMKDAIHVRKVKDGRLILIAGAHRLEAARRLGWTMIPARVWTGVTDDWARLMEIDDNIAGGELTALDTAVFLATRKAVYERLHPETKYATGAALAAKRWDATEPSSVAFVKATAEKFGLTERQIRKIVSAGTKLGPDEVQRLRAAPRPVTLKDLAVIHKIGDPVERYHVVDMLAAGTEKSAAAARKAHALRETGGKAPVQDPVDQKYLALMSAWSRASRAARRRFAEEVAGELRDLLPQDIE